MIKNEHDVVIKNTSDYKVSLLENLGSIPDCLFAFIKERAMICNEVYLGETGDPKDKVLKNHREDAISEYYYYETQIRELNSNTNAQANITHCVSLLLQSWLALVREYHQNCDKKSYSKKLKKELLQPLCQLLDLEYFTKDPSSDVKKELLHANMCKNALKEIEFDEIKHTC